MRHNKHCVFFTLQSDSVGTYSFSYIGENICDALGVSSADVLNDSGVFFNLIKSDDRAVVLNSFIKSRETLEPLNSIIRLQTNDTVYYTEMRLSVRSHDDDSLFWDGVLVDISEQKQYIPEFSRHLDFEILISRISTKFIGLSIDDIDDGIEESLRSIGPFSGSDRALVYLFQEETTVVEKIYEWCDSELDAPGDFYENFSGFYELLSKGDVVYIPDESKLPSGKGNERKHFQMQNVKSLLIIPMMLKEKLYGFLGLISVRRTLEWTLNDQILLRLCGEVFVNALNRKRVEKRISLTSILFEEIMKQSPIPMVVAAPDGRMMIYNEACTEQLGVNFDDYIDEEVNFFEMDQPWVDYDLAGNPIPQSELPLAKGLQGLHSEPIEVMIVRGDGTKRWHIVSGTPIFDKEGSLIAAFTAFPDITKLKQAESSLSRSEAKLRSYVESAPDGIFVADRDGRYLEVNKAACKITGFGRDQLIGMKIASIIYKDDVDAAMDNFRICGEEGRSSGEFRFVSGSGTVKTWSVEAVKLSEDRFLGFTKDITENKRILEQLRQMEKMDAIGQLAGGIAHDFNNQIAVIMGYSEMLISKLTDPKLKHYAENILASSHRSDDLTRKLLAFAHKGLYENTSINIHKLIGEAVDILSHSLDKRISIGLNFKAEPSFIKGDPSQIQNILLNLSLNARDAMPEGGHLNFETSNVVLDETYCKTLPYEVTPGFFIKIIVSDDGTGIDEKDISRIFEPFFTTKILGKGTGMGLASVFGAVTNHHGVIEVKSSPGEGTAFYLYFPQVENPLISTVKTGTFSVCGSNATILLVDDDELIRQLGQDLLGSLGYRVKTCNDGIEALEFFKNNWQQIDLVVLDMIMPELGGKDVFGKLREINPDIPVILSSGFSMSGDIQQLLDEGASAFIGKPFEVSQFSIILAKLLNGD